MDRWLDAFASAFAFLAVLAAAVALAYVFRRQLRQLVAELGIARFSALGVNVEFAEDRAVAAYRKQGLGEPSAADLRRIRDAAEHLAPLAAGRRILWVDDDPAGNRLERETFLSWRIEVQTRRSTDDALAELRPRDEPYDLVISDWTREGEPGGTEAGPRLAQAMGEDGFRVPIVFYHGHVPSDELERRRAEAARLGALGATGSPGELYRLVLLELARRALE